MLWNRNVTYLILFIGILVFAFFLFQKNYSYDNQLHENVESTPAESIIVQKTPDPSVHPKSSNAEIPSHVIRVLNHILKYQEAPPNYLGGRIFENREKKLQSQDILGNKINYREWDVLPKTKGKNRGAERLITGSDHSAYYTKNHYQSFIKINP